MIPVAARGSNGQSAPAVSAAAIYGANASGKTNVIKALRFMAEAVVESHATWKPDAAIPREPFAGNDSPATPSRFCVDFLLDGTRYQYGFEVTDREIVLEWLYVFPKGKRQSWFLRDAMAFKFGTKLKGENETIGRLTRADSLFLSAAAQNNHEALLPVYRLFAQSVAFVVGARTEQKLATFAVFKERGGADVLRRLVSGADFGIEDLQVREDESGFAGIPLSEFQLMHRVCGNSVPFDERQESAGTLAYLSLLGPVLKTRDQGGLLCIDELDASLHPLLAAEIIRWFTASSSSARPAQLIFTAHDTNLLNSDILGRDQIWFTEKDNEGASHLYPLSDFKTRKQENLERGYLQGRYGAIPLINAEPILAGLETDHVPA